MTTTLAIFLVVHVMSGIIGIGMHNTVLLQLIKKVPNYQYVSKVAWSAVGMFLISWGTAAYYYVTYYGSTVKPRILAGTTPVAHTFFMETKEHIFLVLPFVAISIALCVTYLQTHPDENLRKSTAFLAAVALVVGVAVVALGMFVSGSI